MLNKMHDKRVIKILRFYEFEKELYTVDTQEKQLKSNNRLELLS